MVLFHAAFGALKARCPMTINLTSDDLVLAGETKRFQGYCIFVSPLSSPESYTWLSSADLTVQENYR
jgi:hypothetical protein